MTFEYHPLKYAKQSLPLATEGCGKVIFSVCWQGGTPSLVYCPVWGGGAILWSCHWSCPRSCPGQGVPPPPPPRQHQDRCAARAVFLVYCMTVGNVDFDAYVNPIYHLYQLGTSPLHFAAQYGHVTTAEVLLRAGISRDARTKVDRTPLHVACQEGHSEIVDLLVRSGADIEAKDMVRPCVLKLWENKIAIKMHNLITEKVYLASLFSCSNLKNVTV